MRIEIENHLITVKRRVYAARVQAQEIERRLALILSELDDAYAELRGVTGGDECQSQ